MNLKCKHFSMWVDFTAIESIEMFLDFYMDFYFILNKPSYLLHAQSPWKERTPRET